MAYQIKVQSLAKLEPFFVVYGQKCRLPISEEIIEEITLRRRLQYLIKELPEERNQVKGIKGIYWRLRGSKKNIMIRKEKENQNLKLGIKYYCIMPQKKSNGREN